MSTTFEIVMKNWIQLLIDAETKVCKKFKNFGKKQNNKINILSKQIFESKIVVDVFFFAFSFPAPLSLVHTCYDATSNELGIHYLRPLFPLSCFFTCPLTKIRLFLLAGWLTALLFVDNHTSRLDERIPCLANGCSEELHEEASVFLLILVTSWNTLMLVIASSSSAHSRAALSRNYWSEHALQLSVTHVVNLDNNQPCVWHCSSS